VSAELAAREARGVSLKRGVYVCVCVCVLCTNSSALAVTLSFVNVSWVLDMGSHHTVSGDEVIMNSLAQLDDDDRVLQAIAGCRREIGE
jgi:hypothetical protein